MSAGLSPWHVNNLYVQIMQMSIPISYKDSDHIGLETSLTIPFPFKYFFKCPVVGSYILRCWELQLEYHFFWEPQFNLY